jgi:aminotransferase
VHARGARALADVLAPTRVVVLTDEVYEYMCFDGRRTCRRRRVDGLRERTVTIGGFSKTFSITGWRIGYLAGRAPLVDTIGRVFDQMPCAPRAPLQRAVAHSAPRAAAIVSIESLRAEYERRRDRLCTALAVRVPRTPPEGAYYVLADYRDALGDLEPQAAVHAPHRAGGDQRRPRHLFHARPEGCGPMRFTSPSGARARRGVQPSRVVA